MNGKAPMATPKHDGDRIVGVERPESCTWTTPYGVFDEVKTSCGKSVADLGRGFSFCPYCGRPLVEPMTDSGGE